MNQPSEATMHHPTTHEAPPGRLGIGIGVLMGVVAGFLGPIAYTVLATLAQDHLPEATAADVVVGTVAFIIAHPVVLLIAGVIATIKEGTRALGVGALIACGVWLITSAGACTYVFFVALTPPQ